MINLRNLAILTFTVLLALLPVAAQNASSPQNAGQQFTQLNEMLDGTANSLLAAEAQSSSEALPQLEIQPAAQGQQPQVGRLRTAVERVRELGPIIDPILHQEGVPAELAAVVLVESGGTPTALSPKGALGLWQLMPQTARRYGLVVTPDRDERLDILKSTRAAARYLRDLYDRFGDWQLALAAYNAGEQQVQAALLRTGGNTFDLLSHSRMLPEETRKYVPAVLAAMQWFCGPIPATGKIAIPGKVMFATLAEDSTGTVIRPRSEAN